MIKALALLIFLSIAPLHAESSLTFGGATSDRMSLTTTAAMDNLTAFTVIVWVNMTSQIANRRAWRMNTSGSGSAQLVQQNPDVNDFEFFVTRATTGMLIYTANNFSTNTWYCFAVTYNESAGTGEVGNFYYGTQTSNMVEASYATNQDGSGATTLGTVSGFDVGNRPGSNVAFPGQIGTFTMWNKELSLSEIQDQQFSPKPTPGCIVFINLGFNGTGTQYDLSGGGANGTISGAVVSSLGPPIFINGGPN